MPDYEGAYDDEITAMVRDTDREIMAEALGDVEQSGYENQMVDDLSQAEGWDGEDLPIEEVAHRNIYGDTGTNFDRPIEMDTEVTLANKLQQAERERDAYAAAWNQAVAQPQIEAAHAQHREEVRKNLYDQYGIVDSYDDAKLDRFINDYGASVRHAQALQENRMEASLQHAAQKYGQDFQDAYNDVTSMNPNSPLARDIIQTAMATSDPGEAIMELHNNQLVRALGRTPSPPFMPQGYGPPHASRPVRPSDRMEGGWGDADVERDVFDSAFDDGGWEY
jgi:hypothetical protein